MPEPKTFDEFDAAITEAINKIENLKAINAKLVDLLKRSRKGFLYIAKELGNGCGLEDIISEIEAALTEAGAKVE